MPYKDPEKKRESSKLAMRKYRKKMQETEEWRAKEAKRKAEWYTANKETAQEAQRKYRARKKAEEGKL